MPDLANNVRGALWILLAAFFFSSMNAIAKGIPSVGNPDISALQLTFSRYGAAALVLLPWILPRPGLWKPSHLGRYGIRTIAGFGGIVLMFAALRFVPLAEATAIGFTSPIFTVLFAAAFLGEPLTKWRLIAVGIGMSGAFLIALGEDGARFSLAGLIPLVAAVFMGAEVVAIKWLNQTRDHIVTIVFYSNVFGALISLLISIPLWVQPTLYQAGFMFALGLVAVLGQLCVLRGVRIADASFIAPIFYASLVYSAAIGYIVFSEIPASSTFLGCLTILVGAYILTREDRKTRQDA